MASSSPTAPMIRIRSLPAEQAASGLLIPPEGRVSKQIEHIPGIQTPAACRKVEAVVQPVQADGQPCGYRHFLCRLRAAPPRCQLPFPAGRAGCGEPAGFRDLLEILAYAEKRGLSLTGYSYEMGINETVTDRIEDYIVQIEIPVGQPQAANACSAGCLPHGSTRILMRRGKSGRPACSS